jgi:hypothetical protein
MKHIILLLSLLLIGGISLAQVKPNSFFFSGDFSFHESSFSRKYFGSPEKEKNLNISPMVGKMLGSNWAIGLRFGFERYTAESDDFFFRQGYTVDGQFIMVDQFIPNHNENSFFYGGPFIRYFSPVADKTYIHFTASLLQSINSEGKNYAQILPIPCVTCLSYVPSPIVRHFEERFMRAGLDLGLSHFLNHWLAVDIQATVLSYQKTVKEDLQTYNSTWFSSYPNNRIVPPFGSFPALPPLYGTDKFFSTALSGNMLKLGFIIMPGKL